MGGYYSPLLCVISDVSHLTLFMTVWLCYDNVRKEIRL